MHNWFLAALVVSSAAAPPPATCPEVATSGPDVEAVRQRELEGARVNIDGWTLAEARAFFTPDYASVQPDGSVRRLDAVMTIFKDGRAPGWAKSFDLSNLEVSVYHCSSAVVTATAEIRPASAPPDAEPWRIRYLNVWRRSDGRWLNAANQFMRIVPAAQGKP